MGEDVHGSFINDRPKLGVTQVNKPNSLYLVYTQGNTAQ